MASPGTELASLDFGNLIGSPLVAVITAQSIAARSTADFIKTVGFDENNKPVYVDFKYPKEMSPYQPTQNPKVILAKVTTAGSGYAPNQVVNVTFSGGTEEIKATGSLVADASGVIASGAIVNIINPGDYPTTTSVTATVEASPAGSSNVTALISTVSLSQKIDAKPAVFQEMKIAVPILTMLPIPFIKIDLFTLDFNAKITSMETASQSTDASISGSLEVKQRWPGGSAKLNVNAAYKKSTASSSSVERTYSMAVHVQASQDEMPAGMEKLLNILEGAMISTPGEITSGN